MNETTERRHNRVRSLATSYAAMTDDFLVYLRIELQLLYSHAVGHALDHEAISDAITAVNTVLGERA